MKCQKFRIAERKGKIYLTVTYECMHLKCHMSRSINKYLPKLWKEAKDILKNTKLINIEIS
jgi:hypothetical protein